MSQEFEQLRGMIYYEMLMHWRRGWLRLVVSMIVVTPLLMAILARVVFPLSSSLEQSSHEGLEVVTVYIASLLTGAAFPSILIALPIMSAEIIPLDQRYGVRGLIQSLPLKTWVFLTEKLLGTWSALLIGFAISVLLVGVGNRLIVGPYDLTIWIYLWVIGLLPFAFSTSGIGLLIAANRTSRRSATIVGAMLTVPCTIAFIISPLALFYVWISSQLANRQDWTGFLSELPQILTPLSTVIGILALIIVWIVGWGSLHCRQNRA